MTSRLFFIAVLLLACVPLFALQQSAPPQVPDAQAIQKMAARFAPTEIGADLSKLSANDRRVLAKLVEASKIIDALFLRQVWHGNEAMLLDLVRDQSPLGRERLHYFLINKGPWSRIDHNQIFVPGAPAKPAAANYYPAGATKDAIEKWFESLPAAERTHATGFFTTIRRGPDGRFTAVPYSTEYQGELAIAAIECFDRRTLKPRKPLRRDGD